MRRRGLSYYRALAIMAIKAERRRQVEQEGWSPAHDDAHNDASLRVAGECYFRSARGLIEPGAKPPSAWPWSAEWWKPQGVERDLVRAGALFDAEEDRLHRFHARPLPDFDFPVRASIRKVVDELAVIYRHDDEFRPF